MPAHVCTPALPLFDELENSLAHVLTLLRKKGASGEYEMETIDPSDEDDCRRDYQIEGPSGLSLRIRFLVERPSGNRRAVRVQIGGASPRRFTCPPPDGDETDGRGEAALRHQVTAYLFDELRDRLTNADPMAAPSFASIPHVPRLALNRDGHIENLNPAACRLLNCSSQETSATSFFSYVHRKNLRRVMADLAQMVEHGMQRTRWLLRLRSGNDRWRWYRVAAQNHLRSAGTIYVHLQPV